jgi:hypothetical protein
MDDDRKYRQNGYMDSGREQAGRRPPLDVTGPRLPRMVQAVAAARCYNCATAIPEGIEFTGNCPKCNAALHCCKQCAHFEPSTRFQCLKPIPVRIAAKDQANECELFKARVTVARDSALASPSQGSGMATPNVAEPRNATDARAAFDNLFRKTE